MNYCKGFIAPLLLALIALLLVVGGAYVYVEKKQGNNPFAFLNQATSTETGSNTETFGWKTYTNSQYGFEFTYPSAWTVAETGDGLKLTSPNDEGSGITFLVSLIPKGKTPNIICQPFGGEDINSIVNGIHSVECKNLENANGVQYARGVNAGQSTERTYRERTLTGYFLNSKESVVVRTFAVDAAGNEFPSTVPIFDAILRSFKFLTSNE